MNATAAISCRFPRQVSLLHIAVVASSEWISASDRIEVLRLLVDKGTP